jgi:very-short-patch-repair endonuclease
MYSGRKISNKEFDIRLENEYSSFKRESDYIDSKTSIKFSCKYCYKTFKRKPKDLNKLKCLCKEREMKYKDLLTNKEIELVENYINMREKLSHRCKKCDLLFKSSPKSIRNSKFGCPNCSGKIFSMDKYISLLPKNLKLIDSDYSGSNKSHKHLCIDCKFEFKTKPNYIIHMGTNCPNCSKSKGEREIKRLLENKRIKFETEHVVNIDNKKLRFDFYLTESNILIEYDGIQHYKPVTLFGGDKSFIKQIENDNLKDKWCLENNIRLVRISYYENIENILWKKLLL